MKTTISYFFLGFLVVLGLNACGGTANNTAVNTNRAPVNTTGMNTAGNSTGSTVGNAVNSMGNAVSSATTSSPEAFMKDAAQGGMAEVQMGKLAEQKSKNPEIKKFGQMMVTDHTAASNDLKALAAKKKFELPADIGSHKSAYDKLNGLSAEEFDKSYVDEMVSDHESDLKEFQKQADNGSDPEVKAFAAKVVPVISKHLDAIKAIRDKMAK